MALPLPTDEIFKDQWHLRNTTPGLLDLNVVPVWDEYTGVGIDAFVFDDGFDRLHQDLVDHYDTTRDVSYLGPTPNDAYPQLPKDNHGTACMGIIGAARDGTGAVGIAYNATLIGLRGYSDDPAAGDTLDDFIRNTGDGIRHAANVGGDLISMSNGYSGGSSYFDAGITPAEIAGAVADIHYAVETARGGLGLNIIRAAGNARAENWDANMATFTASPEMTIVAAVDQNGFVSDYSSPGASVLISGFGTPGEVVTTDRTGAPGYATNDFTTTFNGTSSATPMVAGVVALMLDANEGLGWRDVQDILAYSARHVGTAVGQQFAQDDEQYFWSFNGAKNWNGGGLHFSNDYGFGLVDGLAAVRLAEHWTAFRPAETAANDAVVTLDALNQQVAIPDIDPNGVLFQASYSGNFDIDSTVVTITLAHGYMADLGIVLYDPNGVASTLHDFRGPTSFEGSWSFSSQAFRGANANGAWTVQIIDYGAGGYGYVSDVQIVHRGSTSSINDSYVFTNEFSDYAGTNAARRTVTDTDGGVDVVNASAVTTASVINLASGSNSVIDGVTLQITGNVIENAIGGDGADVISGNGLNNTLLGGRGADTLFGGTGGTDVLKGGQGDDTYSVTSATVTVTEVAGEGYDSVVSSITYTLTGNVEKLTLGGTSAINGFGNGLANALIGNSAANVLNGAGGADTMSGLGGNDVYVVDNAGDVVVEGANAGIDTVQSAVSYALSANVENLTLVGTAAINGAGNALANTITGNGAANSLNGGAGADTMIGGGGGDTYIFDNVGDRAVEAAGAGTDTVQSYVTTTLGANVENLTMMGSASIDGTGNALGNFLRGNGGNNVLNGLGGADNMSGGAGDDTYYVDSPGDIVAEGLNAGTDTVISSISHSLGSNFEKLTLTGAANASGIGNGLANTIVGNTGANALNGGLGSDVLTGGLGNDRFDFIHALGAGNIDRITDFSVPNDTILLENAVFIGLSVGTLAASAFTIGAAAADSLDRIVYNAASGALFFDRDGTGSAFAAQQFAILSTGLALTNADFYVA